MLSTKEKRFIRHWEDQRKGGKWSYLSLYIVIGTFIVTVILSVFLLIFLRITFGSLFFWIVFIGGLSISTALSLYSWYSNEKRLRELIRREVKEGKRE